MAVVRSGPAGRISGSVRIAPAVRVVSIARSAEAVQARRIEGEVVRGRAAQRHGAVKVGSCGGGERQALGCGERREGGAVQHQTGGACRGGAEADAGGRKGHLRACQRKARVGGHGLRAREQQRAVAASASTLAPRARFPAAPVAPGARHGPAEPTSKGGPARRRRKAATARCCRRRCRSRGGPSRSRC